MGLNKCSINRQPGGAAKSSETHPCRQINLLAYCPGTLHFSSCAPSCGHFLAQSELHESCCLQPWKAFLSLLWWAMVPDAAEGWNPSPPPQKQPRASILSAQILFIVCHFEKEGATSKQGGLGLLWGKTAPPNQREKRAAKPPERIELSALRLRSACSTTELRRQEAVCPSVMCFFHEPVLRPCTLP